MREPNFFEWIMIQKRDLYLNTPISQTDSFDLKTGALIDVTLEYPEGRFEVIKP